MIKINVSLPNDQERIKWTTKCASERAKLIQKYNAGISSNTDLYKKQKKFFVADKAPFHGKCAYCEAKIVSDQHGDIEHYRPKAKICDVNNKVVFLAAGKTPHPGCYWLAYDWTNLLLSCTRCNQLSEGARFGKGNRFPVIGTHAACGR